MVHNKRKASFAVATAFLMASLLVFSIPTIAVASSNAAAGDMGTILIDYSHGAYKASAEHVDLWLAGNLTQMGFEVVFLWGGLNSTILATADGLILPKVWGVENGYLAAEVTAVGDWFNAGNKFLWVGGESDFVEAGGGQAVLDNQTLMLEAVGSHIYHEPTAVQDPEKFAGASYRPIANITTDNEYVAAIVEDVDEVLVHSPTCLYGSTSGAAGVDAVALEDTAVDNVFPLLFHSNNGTIADSDLVAPYAHTDGQTGAFTSVALEINAGADGSGALVVSGGNVIGHYWPMMEDEYAGVTGMDGMRFVKNAIQYGMLHAMTEQGEGKILFDYSHGAYKASAYETDQRLFTSLFLMGYEVVEVWGGLNATILADADGLVLPKVWGVENGYLAAEVTAVADWFNAGNKFMWVGGESDFVEAGGGQAVLDNQTLMLEAVGSHIYHEPTAVQDPELYAGASYRPRANITGSDPFVASVVNGVSDVLVHSPTCLYGSTSGAPGVDAVALEDTSIDNVYILLQHSNNGTIADSDLVAPYAHTDGQVGAFASMAMEVEAGTDNSSVLVVSGGNVLGHYWPMMEDRYAGVEGMNGLYLVRQAIDFGMKEAAPAPEPTTTPSETPTPTGTPGGPIDPMLLAVVGVGVVLVIIIVVVVVRRK